MNDERNDAELISPVYLDHEMMLDLIATAEDGFSLVQQVTRSSSADKGAELEAEGSAGASGLLSLLQLDFNLGAKRTTANSATSGVSAERMHTYGSLLARLRRYLADSGSVVWLSSADQISGLSQGDFIEVSGRIEPNPFGRVFAQLGQTMRFMSLVSDFEARPVEDSSAGRDQAEKQRWKEFMETVSGRIAAVVKEAEGDGFETVIVRGSDSDYSVMGTLVSQYLRSRPLTELCGRDFTILGKVVRVETSETVELLGVGGLSGVSPELLNSLIQAVESIAASGHARIDRPEPSLSPPVVELLPLALFS